LPPTAWWRCPHGLDHGRFPQRRRDASPAAREAIGYIGSVIPVKGVHVLMDAFKMLGRADIELHIHGEGFAFHDDTTYSTD
jgi:glycosyltransferase involved in cell wall biosynthesis